MEDIIEFTSEYGTRQYLKEYIASEFDKIKLVKCTNGEIILGFVQDVFADRITIDFPLQCHQGTPGVNSFFIHEYTPELEYKTVTFNKSLVMFESEPSDDLISVFIEYHQTMTFSNAWDADPLAHKAPETIQ